MMMLWPASGRRSPFALRQFTANRVGFCPVLGPISGQNSEEDSINKLGQPTIGGFTEAPHFLWHLGLVFGLKVGRNLEVKQAN